MKRLLWPAGLAVGVIVADQLTKLWAVSSLTGQPSRHILGEFFILTLVFNEGGAMGTSIGSPNAYLIISLLLLPVLCYYLYRYRSVSSLTIPLALIIGGALGNIIDRLRLGQVVDFIDVDFFDINIFGYHLERWWTFNIADSAITCALVYLLIRFLFFRWDDEQGTSQKRPAAGIAGDSLQ